MRLLLEVASQLQDIKPGSDEFWFFLLVGTGLVLFAGLMSGLTLGLMSLDALDLEVFIRSGTEKEKEYAFAIQPVLKNPHLLLVTLLICNSAAMEALPIVLDKITSPAVAVVISVSLVLLFGEIIPQAVCSRHGLAIGAKSASFVKALMFITTPISWPIAKLLDTVIGRKHSAFFRTAQLKAIVDVHAESHGRGGELTHDETMIIKGAMDLREKKVVEVLTPLENTFMLPSDAKLDQETMMAILSSGHSRIPVYETGMRHNILGFVIVKEMLLISPDQDTPLLHMRLRSLPKLPGDAPLYDVLNIFQTGKSHMAQVMGWGGCSCTLGIVTLEDVLEELLQEEIVDETDEYLDNLRMFRVKRERSYNSPRRLSANRNALEKKESGRSLHGNKSIFVRSIGSPGWNIVHHNPDCPGKLAAELMSVPRSSPPLRETTLKPSSWHGTAEEPLLHSLERMGTSMPPSS